MTSDAKEVTRDPHLTDDNLGETKKGNSTLRATEVRRLKTALWSMKGWCLGRDLARGAVLSSIRFSLFRYGT